MAESKPSITSDLVINNKPTPSSPKSVYSKPVVVNGQLTADSNITNPGVVQ